MDIAYEFQIFTLERLAESVAEGLLGVAVQYKVNGLAFWFHYTFISKILEHNYII